LTLIHLLAARMLSHHSTGPTASNDTVDDTGAKKGAFNSAFYIGHVFHKRFVPKVHKFTYPLYMNFIDLDEVERLDKKFWWFSSSRWAPLQLKPADYLKDAKPVNSNTTTGKQLKATALGAAKILGADLNGINRVCMLAQLRCLGIYFSPVNFFFLYQNNTAKYLIAEVSNTPWNNTHSYLVDLLAPESTDKAFHVSPFMDLDMVYQWQVKEPTSKTKIVIESFREQRLFMAVFDAKRYEINTKKVTAIFLRWPIVTVSIVRAIYWQALKLFIKGIAYVPYQTKQQRPKAVAGQLNIKSKP